MAKKRRLYTGIRPEKLENMKIMITIDTVKVEPEGADPFNGTTQRHRSEIWQGELEILEKNIYLTKISILGHGEPQPICEIPFAIGIGHYLWIPPYTDTDDDGDESYSSDE